MEKINTLPLTFKEKIIALVGKEVYDFSETNYINNYTSLFLIENKTQRKIEITNPGRFLKGLKKNKGSSADEILRKATEEKFKNLLIDKFGENRFDFSCLHYVNTSTPVEIICNLDGNHIKDKPEHLLSYTEPCGICREANAIWTTEKFIKYLEETFGTGYYDYSHVNYINALEKVLIICPEHGEQWVQPAKLTCKTSKYPAKYPCPVCGYEKREHPLKLTTEEFIRRAKEVHGDTYDYSNTEYKSMTDDVTIFCKECQEYFTVNAELHLRGVGCNLHNGPKVYDTETFIKASKEKFGDKFDYSKVTYINRDTPVILICPEHGEIEITPKNHLDSKTGCTYCGKGYIPVGENGSMGKEEFIRRAIAVHGEDTYDYSEVEYVNNRTPVKIFCRDCGEYFWQKPNWHLSDHGCPCHVTSTGEKRIKTFLDKNHIKYTAQMKFEGLKDKDYLKFDFYLPDFNTCIEFQGVQHKKPVEQFGGEEGFKLLQKHDQMKKDFCEKKSIKLVEIWYSQKSKRNLELLLAKLTGIEEKDIIPI